MIPASLRRFGGLVAVAGLLAFAAVLSGHSALPFTRVEQPVNDVPPFYEEQFPPTAGPQDAPAPSPTPERVAPAEPAEMPGWVGTLLVVLGALAVAVSLGVLVRALMRDVARRAGRRAAPRPQGETTAEVVAALEAGLDELSDSDADPRRAVIGCWLRLEEAATAAGIERQIGDTPTDLVSRLLGRESTRISAGVLDGFADVYRQARYARHQVDEQMRAQARAALERVRDELAAEVGT
ncbi:DUF4129 domain-containing protein [Melissospora conviva]|uniref:DUF4129 domain-containing protein n=1 Tax=Melissospora conviva TaxID=3388432 RepID=UPI003C260E32